MDTTQPNGNAAIDDTKAAAASARDKLMGGLNSSISEAEKWLEESADEVGEAASELRSRFDDTLRTAKEDLRKLEDSLLAHGREAAETANVYVQENPWKAVGIGAAVGVLIGLLVSRK